MGWREGSGREPAGRGRLGTPCGLEGPRCRNGQPAPGLSIQLLGAVHVSWGEAGGEEAGNNF